MKNKLLPVPQGYKAIVHHAFNADDIDFWSRLVLKDQNHFKRPKYMTVVDVIDTTTGEVIVTGIAKCSKRDNPSRKMGRMIAHNRAVKALSTARSGR